MNSSNNLLSCVSRLIVRPMALGLVAVAAGLWVPSAKANTNIFLPWYEPFNYDATGSPNLGANAAHGSDSWGNGNKASQKFAVGSLSYPGLPPSQGNRVAIISTGTPNNFNEARPDISPAISSGAMYVSFLLRVRDTTGIGTTSPGNAIVGICTNGGSGRFGSINLWNNGGTIKVGAVKWAGSATISSSSFFPTGILADNSTTYFIVLKYGFVDGTANDAVTVWVNPSSSYFGGTEDPGNLISTSTGADGVGGLSRVYLLTGQNVDVDEFRVGTSWAAVVPNSCDPVSIVQPPQASTNGLGTAVSLTASAAGTAPISYQWRRYGTNLVDGGNISGATSNMLVIDPLTAADAAAGANGYSVLVANTCGSGSSQASAPVDLVVVNGNNLTWSGNNGATWDTSAANWNGDTAVFTTLDNVTFNDSSANTTVTLADGLQPLQVAVNATRDYTFSGGSIAGPAFVVKTNTGKLTLDSVNTYTGRTTVKQGTLAIGAETALGGNPDRFKADQLTLDGGALEATASFTLNDSHRGITLGANGGTFNVDAGANLTVAAPIAGTHGGSLVKTGDGILSLALVTTLNTYNGDTVVSNGVLSIDGDIVNPFGLGGTLNLAGGRWQTVSRGKNAVSDSDLGIFNPVLVSADSELVTLNPNAKTTIELRLYNSTNCLSGNARLTIRNDDPVFPSNLRVALRGSNATYNGEIVLATGGSGTTTLAADNPTGTHTFNGVLSGIGAYERTSAGTTLFNNHNTYSGGTRGSSGSLGFGTDSVGSPSVTSGPIGTGPLVLAGTTNCILFASGGPRVISNPVQYQSGTNSPTLTIDGGNNLTLAGGISLNGNDGLTAPTITARNIQVTGTGLATLSGVLSDGGWAYGLTKTGSGVLALNNAETYTGATTVSNGTLLVNGALNAASAVTVQGGALGGTGSIGGPVTVHAGGALVPGVSIGTLTVNNDLTFSGDLIVEVNRAGFASDQVSVSGALANTGTGSVLVTNLGVNLQVGDTFALFNKALLNGAAMAITGGGVTWSNRLALDGKIQVLSVTPTTPTNLSYSLSGNSLTLSWPASYLGWSLQSNAVSIASPSNWFTVPGSDGTTQIVIPVDPAKPNVFYRLSLP